MLPDLSSWRPRALTYGLSLAQPWAWCVVHGPKRVENRGWTWSQQTVEKWTGVRIAIHAAKSWDRIGQESIRASGLSCPMQVELPAGAVVGAATIERVLERAAAHPPNIAADQMRWVFGPLCLVLSDVVAIAKPIPCRGMLGLWWLPTAVQQDLAEHLREAP